MRDIKFRGQTGTTEGKKWVYGHYYKVKSFFNDKEAHFIGIIRNNHLTDFSIDENTLGQCTGLKDKKGKEIYEGDIVKVTDEGINYYVVEWDKDEASFKLVHKGETIYTFCDISSSEDTEIIGHIYENKELLEEREEK